MFRVMLVKSSKCLEQGWLKEANIESRAGED